MAPLAVRDTVGTFRVFGPRLVIGGAGRGFANAAAAAAAVPCNL
jgi:hypothetical protein